MSRDSCPEAERWQALLESDVDEVDPLLAHLETCGACRMTLENLAAEPMFWDAALEAAAPPEAPEPALRLVIEHLQQEESDCAHEIALPPSSRPGSLGVLGPYEILAEIGRGGMGIVFKALDPLLDRLVAIKVLPQLAPGAAGRRRFLREARAAAVAHEHIVTIHGVHDEGPLAYLVMEYVIGESLQDRLDQVGPLPLEDILRLGAQIARGLAAAHGHGIVHRDIKPANLLLALSRDGHEAGAQAEPLQPPALSPRVKITDFGLARMDDDAHLTREGVLAGTPAYMAPEQARGEPVDYRADLFSLGSVLYAMCTGISPFQGPSAVAALCRVAEQTPASLHLINPAVPSWLEALVERLLAKDPAARPQSADEVAAHLERGLAQLQTGLPASELPASGRDEKPLLRKARRRRRWVLGAGAGLLGICLLVAGLWLGAGGGQPEAGDPGQPAALHDFLYQDFRGNSELVGGLTLVGKNPESYVHSEKQGLRITLPANRVSEGNLRGIAVACTQPIAGDFQITGSYELLAAGLAAGNEAAGVALFFQRAPDGNRHGKLGRLNLAEGPVYEVRDAHYRQTLGKVVHTPTKEATGRLRIERRGSLLTYLVQDATTQGKFKELHRAEFGVEPLKLVLFEVNPSRNAVAVDARLIDLRIQTGTPGAAPSQPATPLPDPDSTSRSFLRVIGLSVAFTMLLAALGLVFVLRKRWRRVQPARPNPTTAVDPAPEAHRLFACPHCRKKLRARTELAARTIACPKCGKPALVP